MKCAIMQPTYLPWSGYFSLLASVDMFVVLDDVQFVRKTWQSMNRIMHKSKVRKIEVPVQKQALDEKIANINIDNSKNWRVEHNNAIRESYISAEGGVTVVDLVEANLLAGHDKLVDLNTSLFSSLAALLAIETPTIRASELHCAGRRSAHVAEICRRVGADTYVSPLGAREYLEADAFEETFGREVEYADFSAHAYPQRGGGTFVSHLSVIDVIANCGVAFARQYVLGNTK